MKTKEMAKGNGRMLFFEFSQFNVNEPPGELNRISLEDTNNHVYFFRARNKKLITDNMVEVDVDCVKNTPLKEIPIGEKRTFIAGDPMKFEGIARKPVDIERYPHLEIEIIPDELYFYSFIDADSKCRHLVIAQ